MGTCSISDLSIPQIVDLVLATRTTTLSRTQDLPDLKAEGLVSRVRLIHSKQVVPSRAHVSDRQYYGVPYFTLHVEIKVLGVGEHVVVLEGLVTRKWLEYAEINIRAGRWNRPGKALSRI